MKSLFFMNINFIYLDNYFVENYENNESDSSDDTDNELADFGNTRIIMVK